MDKYSCFKSLAAEQILNQDYRIRVQDLGSLVTIVAPHGGRIEPRTCLVARQIAGHRFNCYCFEGIKPKDNQDLHITSHCFDEPRALSLIGSSDIVVTIHACADPGKVVYIGGRFTELAGAIEDCLGKFNVIGIKKNHRFPGVHSLNICNRGRLGKGVQIEISRGLRDNMDQLIQISDVILDTLLHRIPLLSL